MKSHAMATPTPKVVSSQGPGGLAVRPPNRTGLPDGLKAGLETLSGLSMDDVRVRYGSPEPARLGALAHTRGTEIHVAPGQERHLAHEGWHVVQQKQGRVAATTQLKGVGLNDDTGLEREADAMAGRLEGWRGPAPGVVGLRAGVVLASQPAVQRQLAAYATLVKDGTKTTGKQHSMKASLRNKFGATSTYTKILEKLKDYEAKQNGIPLDDTKIRRLREIRILMMGWLDKRDPRHDTNDPETVRRSKAIQTALHQVTMEWMSLQAGQGGWTDRYGTNKGILGKGAMNTVEKIDYINRTAAFKADQNEDSSATAGVAAGIPIRSPNMSGRAVATYRLDRLLGTDVIPETTFAAHGGKVGTAMTLAKGRAAIVNAEVEVTRSERVKEIKEKFSNLASCTPGSIEYEDLAANIRRYGCRVENEGSENEKVFEKKTQALTMNYDTAAGRHGLSNLQLLDALCGQVDRHVGNIFLDTSKSDDVTGVSGIDNDLSFGQDHVHPDQFLRSHTRSSHDVGLPAFIDEKVGKRVLELTESAIKKQLEDLLTPKEIEATLKRFRILKAHVNKNKNNLVTDWNDTTVVTGTQKLNKTNSYLRRDQEWAIFMSKK